MDRPVRKLTRARQFDYRAPGSYFVTICLAHRGPWLGSVTPDATVHLTPAGAMVAAAWRDLPHQYAGLALDAFIVMPDHLHGLLTLPVGDDEDGVTLSQVKGWFKTVTTKRYGVGVRRHGWQPYDGRWWQAGFHDHIIRDDRDLEARRLYIERNPWRWLEKHDVT